MDILDSLYEKTIEKKEISNISKDLVLKVLNKIISSYNRPPNSFSEKEKKLIIKKARSELRDYAGRFQSKFSSREKLLLSKSWLSLLNTHSSTKERIPYYEEIKSLIYSFSPKSILDIGCGLNPLAIANKKVIYYASDINLSDLEIVKSYFKENNIQGEVFPLDVTSDFDFLPETDITLLFKLLDFLEKKSRGVSEKLLSLIKSKIIIVSFANIKLSGKKMNNPKRLWFEKMCYRLLIKFESREIGNEIFYILTQ